MKLSLKLIFSDLEDTRYICRPKEHESTKFISARLAQSWSDLKNREVLYIADESFDFTDYRFPSNDQDYTLLLTNPGNDSGISVCKQVQIYTVFSPLELTNEILSVFDKYNAWDSRLNEILNQDGSLADLLTVSVPIFNNALYVVDSSFKVLAITDIPIIMEMSAIWRHLILHGYMPINIVAGMQEENELYRLSRFEEAIFFRSKMIHNVFISMNLKINDVAQGKLFIVGMLNRLRDRDLELTEHLASIVQIALKRMSSFVLGHGQIYEHFLIDVLAGSQTDTQLISEQLTYWKWNLNQLYSLLLIPTRNHDIVFLDAVRSELQTIRGGQSVYFEDMVVVIFPHRDILDFKDNLKYLSRYLNKLKLQGHASTFYKGFQHMREYYLQTRHAMELSSDDGTSYLQEYKDYVLPLFLKDCCDSRTMHQYCNQAIQILREFDEANHTHYFLTLETFLKNERSLKQTALDLNIHRNTLINRIEKIQAITELDLEDYHIRIWLLLSFEIQRRY